MLPKAHIGRRSGAVLANIDHYRELVGDGLIDEIMGQGRALIGIRICQINATANDGGVENAEVNMFQRGGGVMWCFKNPYGKGLVVSEALWKERAIVAGRAGGIPMQFPEGFDRFLIVTVEECADRVLDLLTHVEERGK
jgi:hypothetical protein